MFRYDLDLGRLVKPYDLQVDLGRYWLTSLKSKRQTRAARQVSSWLLQAAGSDPF
jgi:LysR family transcriptional regulator of beta-lactamase